MVELTKRQMEVLSLAAEGESNKRVADRLYCSKRTVDFHLSRAYERLGASNRIEAIRIAYELGLLTF